MGTSIDDAVVLGLTVQAALVRQDINPGLTDGIDPDVRAAALARSLQFLQAAGLISETDLGSLSDFLGTGARPASTKGDPRSVGSVLIAVAQRYPYYGSTVIDVTAALTAVADSAADGLSRAGQAGAVCCAAIAAVQVLREQREAVMPDDHAHKE
jgi:hypothetical protein